MRLALLAPAPTHALVTLGGYDAGFGALLRRCVLGGCGAPLAAATADLPELGSRLEAAYRGIGRAAPGAWVLAVGYPEIVPEQPPRGLRCLWLSDAEVPAALRFIRALDATIAAAAERAGVEHVPVGNALDGHELCTPASWVRRSSSTPSASTLSRRTRCPPGRRRLRNGWRPTW